MTKDLIALAEECGASVNKKNVIGETVIQFTLAELKEFIAAMTHNTQAAGAATQPDTAEGLLREYMAFLATTCISFPKLEERARRLLASTATAPSAPTDAKSEATAALGLTRDDIVLILEASLRDTYHCTRVWDAWHVGTMSESDFEPVDESDTIGEIADAILASMPAAPSAQDSAAPSSVSAEPGVSDKLIAECMASVSDPLQWGTFPKDLRDAVREFSHLLALRLVPFTPTPGGPSAEDKTWAAYIAAMIETYLNFDNPKEGREAAIAGIIERRMWSVPAAQAVDVCTDPNERAGLHHAGISSRTTPAPAAAIRRTHDRTGAPLPTGKRHSEPGAGDDVPCSKCGAALNTGLECTECGHDMAPELASPAPAAAPQAGEPVPYLNERLQDFICRRVENAGNTPGLTLYFTKLGAHPEYQLYTSEALALWVNLGKALGSLAAPPAPAAAPQAGEPVAPEGYKLVVVPDEVAPDEPDWEECVRQAEVSTGLKVDRNTFSIVKREIRRWIAHKYATPSPALAQPQPGTGSGKP